MKKQSADKKEIKLPLVALGLDFLPMFFILLTTWGLKWISFFGLVMILSPITGMLVGIAALRRGREQNGTVGMIIAIIAIALPLICVGLILYLFIGAATGLITFM
jgi:hypothetical protein